MASIEGTARFVIATLLSGFWQAPLFATLAWGVLLTQPRANATTRHSVFAFALLASLVIPVVTASLATTYATDEARATGNASSPKHLLPFNPSKHEAPVPTRMRTDSGTGPATLLSIPTLPRMNLGLPKVFVFAIVLVWLAGAGLVLIRLIVSLLHLERLKRDALPLTIEYRARLTRWASVTKGWRNVRLCTSDEIEVPIAVGLFDAMILVPSRLLEELEPHDIDSIVLHELAHLRRNDDWINAIERFGHAVLFFNPGIAWIAGQLDLEREVACDDWVLQQNDALPYATCLAKVVESTAWPYRAMTAPGAFVTRRGMSIRIERLLAKQRDVCVHTSFGPTGVAVAVLAVFGIVAAFVSPSIAFSVVPTPPEPPAPAVALGSPAPKAPKAPKIPTVPVVPRAANIEPQPLPLPQPHKILDAVTIAEATNPDYIDELAGVGYSGLSVAQLIQLKALGVSADYIRNFEREGLGHPAIADLARMRAIGVDAKYAREMRRRYGASLGIEDVVEMKAVGVTASYSDALAGAGLKDLSANQARNLRALGVTPEYVRDLAQAGYPNLSYDQLQSLKALGVDRDFIERANKHGFHHVAIPRLIELRSAGVL